jgi:putative transposase
MAEKRKIYDRIFKEKAVLLSYERKNISQIEKELGISGTLLTKWRQDYQKFGTGSFRGPGNKRVHPEKEKIFELEKKIKESELNFEILNNGSNYLLQGKLMAYHFIKSNEKTYPISKMCKVLQIGETGYRAWRKQAVSERKRQIILLKEEIIFQFFDAKQYYGSIRITRELHNLGYQISSSQVSVYMKRLGLRSTTKRKFKVTTDSKHNFYTAPNVLNQEFKVKEPSRVWVSDITYIQTRESFLYLTIIMDLFDRKIIGWSLSNTLSSEQTSLAALEMAAMNRKISNELIFHSDRGVQYANKAFASKIDSYKYVTRSMSRKGNHLDNAVSESFFSTLKRELIYRSKLLTKKQMKVEIFEYIENWYNKKRIHSALNYKTIEEFNNLRDI